MRRYVTQGLPGRLSTGPAGNTKAERIFLKKTLYLIAAFLFMLSLGSVSASLDDQPQGVFQNGYEWTEPERVDISGPLTAKRPEAPAAKKAPLTLAQAPRSAPRVARAKVTASWYGAAHHNKRTAHGQRFDMHKNTLAHRTLPLGTRVRLINPANGRSAVGIVNDRGPYIKGRQVDVSYAMARQLGFVEKGVVKLELEKIAAADKTRPRD